MVAVQHAEVRSIAQDPPLTSPDNSDGNGASGILGSTGENSPTVDTPDKASHTRQAHMNRFHTTLTSRAFTIRIDDEIFDSFKESFPDLFNDVKHIQVADEGLMKSPEAKVRWRKWIEQ